MVLVIPSATTYLERQGRVLVEADRGSDGVGVGTGNGSKVGRILGKVDERRVGDGLSTARVRDADELLEQDLVLVVVPVSEDDGELFVVLVLLLWRVDDYRGAETVDVLTLVGIALAHVPREMGRIAANGRE